MAKTKSKQRLCYVPGCREAVVLEEAVICNKHIRQYYEALTKSQKAKG